MVDRMARPVAMTTSTPASATARTPWRTAGDIKPSRDSIVPSRSIAIRLLAVSIRSSNRRYQDVDSEEGTQRGRYDDRAVGLLVVLQNSHQPASGAQRAVDGRDVARGVALGLRVALASVETAGLVGRAVRGRRQLAVAALRRNPRLAVELARRRTTEVAGRGVDDPVGHLDLGQHLPLAVEQPLVLSLCVFGAAVAEHLDLLELVHPDDAAGVLAV